MQVVAIEVERKCKQAKIKIRNAVIWIFKSKRIISGASKVDELNKGIPKNHHLRKCRTEIRTC